MIFLFDLLKIYIHLSVNFKLNRENIFNPYYPSRARRQKRMTRDNMY